MAIQLGFVRAGYNFGAKIFDVNGSLERKVPGGLVYEKGGKAFICLAYYSDQDVYEFRELVMFYESDIPEHFRQELEQFYEQDFKPAFVEENMEREISFLLVKQFFHMFL